MERPHLLKEHFFALEGTLFQKVWVSREQPRAAESSREQPRAAESNREHSRVAESSRELSSKV